MKTYLIAALVLFAQPTIAAENVAPIAMSRDLSVQFAVPASLAWPAIAGTTNLPDGTELQISLETPVLACRPNYRSRESKSVVKNGQFMAGPFDLDPGVYTLKIATNLAELQPPEVRAIIGAHGEYLRGRYVKPELMPGYGPTVGYVSQVMILAPAGGSSHASTGNASPAPHL
jgi:hypothetical protein